MTNCNITLLGRSSPNITIVGKDAFDDRYLTCEIHRFDSDMQAFADQGESCTYSLSAI